MFGIFEFADVPFAANMGCVKSILTRFRFSTLGSDGGSFLLPRTVPWLQKLFDHGLHRQRKPHGSGKKNGPSEFRGKDSLGQILESNIDAVIVLDATGNVVFANDGFLAVSGYRREEIDAGGISLRTLVREKDRQWFEFGLAERIRNPQKPGRIMVEMLTKRGDTITCECIVSSIGWNGRNCVLVSGRDISMRVQSEQALKESEALFREIAEAAFDGLALLDMDGKFQFINRRFARVSGYTEQELIGCHFTRLAFPEDRHRLTHRYQRRASGEAVKSEYETRLLRKDGTSVPIMISVRKVFWHGAPVFSAVYRDLSEHKLLQNELLRIGEWERIRIGQDLHDTIGQQLAGMAYLLEELARKLGRENSSHFENAREIARIGRTAHEQLREAVQTVLPLSEHEGLHDGLKRLCLATGARQGVFCRLNESEMRNIDVNAVTANHLVCIAQEAVANAVRHGNAHNIEIDLRREMERAKLTIRDDGCGFEVKAHRDHGSGLRIMHYRADVIGGLLTIASRKGEGATVSCAFEIGSRNEENLVVTGLSSPAKRSVDRLPFDLHGVEQG